MGDRVEVIGDATRDVSLEAGKVGQIFESVGGFSLATRHEKSIRRHAATEAGSVTGTGGCWCAVL